MPEFGGFMDGFFQSMLVFGAITLAIPIIIVIVVVWAIRRSAPVRRDPAEESLRERLARGDIDQAEFLVRMRALHDGDDKAIT
jgi:uncharacterized membrane protein